MGTQAGGFVVANTEQMVALVPSGCTNVVGGCAAFCPGVCLRQLRVQVSALVGPLVLRLTSEATGRAVEIKGQTDYFGLNTRRKAVPDDTIGRVRMSFYVALPHDESFSASFDADDGLEVWPLFAQVSTVSLRSVCSVCAACLPCLPALPACSAIRP
jgi:hypothetical protein